VREQLFEDGIDMPNVQESLSLGSLVDAQQTRESLEGKHVCPYCGAVNESPTGPCPNCSLENTPTGRKATKSRIGPWYVLQRRNPAAPGMKYEMLLNFVRKGRVKPRTVVRGPTTHQLWRFAAHVKGLSREFGLCYSCGGKIESSSTVCPQCNRLQLAPLNPDALLESGDAESPPGGLAMAGGLVGAGNAAPVNGAMATTAEQDAPEPAAAEAETNHDIIVPALTDLPGQAAMASAPATAKSNGTHGEVALAPAVGEPSAPSAPPQSMALAMVGMPTIAEAPVGARARSAALKAGGGFGMPSGPRVVPLGSAGVSPAPVLTPSAAPATRYSDRGRWRGAAEMILFLLVLVGGVGAAVLMADPSLRDQAEATYDRVLKAIHLSSDGGQPLPETPAAGTEQPQYHPPAVPPYFPPAPPPRLSSTTPKPAAPLPPPQPAAQPAAHTEAPTADVHASTPATHTDSDSEDNSAGSDQARAKALYFAAIDAEQNSDWATAVKDYRQILQLPKSVQYTDVEQRLRTDETLLAQAQSAGH
jgi:hypothetical protein